MASLLEQVLDSKENPNSEAALSPKDDRPHTLPDGSVVYDSTIAAINRILEVNPDIYKSMNFCGEYELYNGSQKVDLESASQLLALIRGDWEPKTKWQLTFLKEKIFELAPAMTYDYIAVSPGLYWDKLEAKLKRINEEDNIRTEL